MRAHHMFVIAALMMASAYATSSWQPSVAGATPSVTDAALNNAPSDVASTLRRSCLDCHSDQTRWPWYASVPPASWLIKRDVQQARGQLNFSRWAGYNRFDQADKLDRVCDVATARQMPPWQYLLLHRDARLDSADIRILCGWTTSESMRLVEEGNDGTQ